VPDKMSYILADLAEIRSGVATGKSYLEKSTDNDLFKKYADYDFSFSSFSFSSFFL
jgi:hypothetical protein